MQISLPVFIKRFGGILLLLGGTWFLFNTVFFLGTHPTAFIDLFFQYLFRVVWHTVSFTTVRDFLVYGFLTGLGGFLVYVPNIMLLFLFTRLLFDSGLVNFAARLVDPFFRLFGLSGYSFPPLLFGFGCSVNALHSAQNIANRKNRLVTMLIAPFMSCGSKFGVYVLLISVVFRSREAGTVLFVLYTIGIVVSLISAVLFRMLLKIKRDEITEPLLPVHFTMPDIRKVLKQTLNDGWIFCKKAGSVIVVASMVIWALSYWPGVSQNRYNELKEYSRKHNQPIPSRMTYSFHFSYLAKAGHIIEPVFRPMGQDWKNSIALLSSFAGRGIIISTLITVYGIEYSPEGKKILSQALQMDEHFSKLSALALMLFVLLCGSCLASITMFYHETKSIKYTILFTGYPIVVAWIICVFFYQTGSMVVG